MAGNQGFNKGQGGKYVTATLPVSQRATAPVPGGNPAAVALAERIARLNNYRLVLAIDSTLPVGVVRCVECGRYASEESPEGHDCPLPKFLEEGIPLGRARDLARAGFENPTEVAMWMSAIDEMGMSEASAFKTLGYSPIDAKRAADAGQSGYQMLAEMAEVEQAATAAAAAPAAKSKSKATRAAKAEPGVVAAPPIDTDKMVAGWTAALAAGAPEGTVVVVPTAEVRAFNKMAGRAHGGAVTMFVADGTGNVIISDSFGRELIVLPDATDAGAAWSVPVDRGDLAKMMSPAGKTLTLTVGDGVVTSGEGVSRPLGSRDLVAAKPGFGGALSEQIRFSDDLARDIAAVSKSASSDAARPILTRVEVEHGDGGGNIAVATDSYRLRVRADASEIPEDGNWASRRKVGSIGMPTAGVAGGVSSIRAVPDKDGFSVGGTALVTDSTGKIVGSEQYAGQFPEWRRLFGYERPNHVMLPNTPGLRKTMKAACPDSAPIRVERDSAGRSRLVGKGRETRSVVYTDPDFDDSTSEHVISFNPDYLADILDEHEGPVECRYVDSLKPAIFPHARGTDLLMPVRV